MREVHLMNSIKMYNIIMTSFNKIKFTYLIQVWEDVMKMIRNVKNDNVEKYCGEVTIWTYPLLPMSPLVTILGYSPPPSPRISHSGGGKGALPPSYNFLQTPPPPPKSIPPMGCSSQLKMIPPSEKEPPPPPSKHKTPFHEMIPRKRTINNNSESS